LFWEESCVSFSVDSKGAIGLSFAETEDLVKGAFAAWPNAQCGEGFPSIAVMSFGPTTCDDVEFNRTGPNANAVIFQSQKWPHDLIQIGLTTVTFNTSTGKILGADIEINTAGFQLNVNQLKFAVTHEAGHFFGLDHSPISDAIMFASYALNGDEPVLTDDDIAGICAAYPSDRRQTACKPEPARGYAQDCGGNVEGSCALNARAGRVGAGAALLSLVIAIVGARRRARRDSA